MAGWSFDSEAFTMLDDRLEERVKAMIHASGGRLWLVSGYRSVERQEQLWNQALAKYDDPEIADNWVARPGQSNHNHGLAVDIGGTEEGKAWMRQNMHRFGLWQPMDHEPWHLELMDTALDEEYANGWTKPPLGGKPNADPTDPGTAMVRLLATLDKDRSGGFEAPGSGMVEAPGGISVENPVGATVDPGEPIKDFGFKEVPGMVADQIEELIDDE